MMQPRGTHKKIFLFIFPTILVVIVTCALFLFFNRMQAAEAARNRTLRTLSATQDLLISLVNAETGMRGYMLTGDDDALRPYLDVEHIIDPRLEELKALVSSPEAMAQIELVAPKVKAKMERLQESRLLKQNGDEEVLRARILSGEGRRAMDAARVEIAHFTEIENIQLARDDRLFRHNINYLFATIVGANILLLFLAQALSYGIYRNIRMRFLNIIHEETKRSLDTQEAMNQQLNVAYAALQANEKKLDVTLNSITDAVIATDREARVTLMNGVSENITRWAQQSALGRPIGEVFRLMNREGGDSITTLVKAALATGQPNTSTENVLVLEDGCRRNISNSCAPIRDQYGDIIGTVLVFRDVTQEFAAQQALHDSTAMLQTILATVDDGIITFTVGSNLIETVNSSAEKMFGYNVAEFIGQHLSAIIPELNENHSSLEYYNGSCDDSAKGLVREVHAQHKNGLMFPVELKAKEMNIGGQSYFTCVIRNITGRKNTEAEMREAESRYRHLFNTIDEGFTTIEMIYEDGVPVDYRFIDVNPSFAKQTGLLNVQGKRVLEVIPDLDPIWFDVYGGVTATGDPIRFVQYIPSLKRWFDVYACSDSVKDSKKIIILFTDITKRMQNEQALLSSEERVRLATEATGVGIWEWNLTHQTLHWDAQMFRIYGVPPSVDGFVELDDWERQLDPQDLPVVQQALRKTLGASEKVTREFRVKRCGEKNYRYIRSVEISRTNAQGKVESIVGTNLDITEIKRTEATLRESERHLRTVIDALPVAIYTTDAKGALTHFNQAAVEFSGYPPQLGNDKWCTTLRLFHPDGAPMSNETCPMVVAMVEGRQILGAEAIAERPDSSRIWFNAFATPLHDANGELIGGINMLIDITERNLLDQALLQNNIELEKSKNLAEKANLAKSDFLSNMSHELRTPLSAILGFAQLIESSIPPPTPSQKRSVDQILRAGWYLLDLINEILDLTLIESGKLSVSLEAVSVVELLRECQTMIEPQALKRKITLNFSDIEDKFFVNADPTRLKQVIVNLLSNAVKYNCDSGKITIKCFASGHERVTISIEDTGSGIAAEHLSQLFQPFNRLGKENSSEEGTGIGLIMTQRLMELMGGEIDVKSTLGVGSIFSIELAKGKDLGPVIANFKLAAKAGARHDDKATAKHTVLYVEDNAANLILVRDILELRKDILLLSASNGYDGIELAKVARPDVILMDINLPGINGTEVLNILAGDPVVANIPVIALTANAIPRDIANGLNAGFFRYLTKPIKIKEFMNVLDMALALEEKKSMMAKSETAI